MVSTNYLTTLLVLILGISLQQGGAVFVAEGGVAVLPCDLQFDPTKVLVWFKGSHGAVLRLLPSGNVHQFYPFHGRVNLTGPAGSDLKIKNVGSSPYECQVGSFWICGSESASGIFFGSVKLGIHANP
ncbi:uncharacterized protein LOC144925579 [Branchiostoma floridae x Branchiostoma belcheri]